MGAPRADWLINHGSFLINHADGRSGTSLRSCGDLSILPPPPCTLGSRGAMSSGETGSLVSAWLFRSQQVQCRICSAPSQLVNKPILHLGMRLLKAAYRALRATLASAPYLLTYSLLPIPWLRNEGIAGWEVHMTADANLLPEACFQS